MAAAGAACRLCREDQLDMECCRGGLLPPSTGLGGIILLDGDGGEEDRVSALPDDILLQILARLGCARAAAHTDLLARRWRGLWAHLPASTFHCIEPGPLRSTPRSPWSPAPRRRSSTSNSSTTTRWSRPASPRCSAPAELAVQVLGGIRDGPAQLPCFDRTTSITIKLGLYYFVDFTLPPAGGFPALESLHLEYGCIDLRDLLPRCPRLRKLLLRNWNSESIMVRSPSLQEFNVQGNFIIEQLEIVAPTLKRLYVDTGIDKDCNVVFSAPAVEDLSWKCECKALTDRFGVLWRMCSLSFEYTLLDDDSHSVCLQSQAHSTGLVLASFH